ncbi:putative membrane protein [Microbacterium marinum]|uniref:Putative membrane protein n=1 Tax=Microbacterium marinum TaxID=421115 RepID=A0A7W7FJG9_9MICO|nr:hypothetical protein [Microbacterium marinum]MBB4667430.1 putative membrane protein [Microbacterium marinum]
MQSAQRTESRWSMGEIVGAVVAGVALIVFLLSAVAYGRTYGLDQGASFFGLLVSFATVTTGVGWHVAAREARFRRNRG